MAGRLAVIAGVMLVLGLAGLVFRNSTGLARNVYYFTACLLALAPTVFGIAGGVWIWQEAVKDNTLRTNGVAAAIVVIVGVVISFTMMRSILGRPRVG